MSVNCIHSMVEYDTALLCVSAANILMKWYPGKQTKEAMKFSGLKQVGIEYDT